MLRSIKGGSFSIKSAKCQGNIGTDGICSPFRADSNVLSQFIEAKKLSAYRRHTYYVIRHSDTSTNSLYQGAH